MKTFETHRDEFNKFWEALDAFVGDDLGRRVGFAEARQTFAQGLPVEEAAQEIAEQRDREAELELMDE